MVNKLFRKGLVIAVIFLIFGISFISNINADTSISGLDQNNLTDSCSSVSFISKINEKKGTLDSFDFASLIYDDELDQYNINPSNFVTLNDGLYLAQSFKPSLGSTNKCVLSRVEVLLNDRWGKSLMDIFLVYDLKSFFTIRAQYSFTEDSMLRGYRWVKWNFDDVPIIPEETYYIVIRGYGNYPTNCYSWSFTENNNYTNGTMWSSKNLKKWVSGEGYNYDMCFKTYRTEHIYKPELNVDKNSFNLGGISKRKFIVPLYFNVKNSGDVNSTLFWIVKSKPNWVNFINPSYGLLAGKQETNVTFLVNTIGLNTHTNYSGSIQLIAGTYGGGNQTISISFTLPRVKSINSTPLNFQQQDFISSTLFQKFLNRLR